MPVQGNIALEKRAVPLAADSTLATKILAGTRGSAGALTEQVWYEADILQLSSAVFLCGCQVPDYDHYRGWHCRCNFILRKSIMHQVQDTKG